MRPVVIHEHHLAAGDDAHQQRIDDGALVVLGKLVQQEIAAHRVVGPAPRGGGIGMAHGRLGEPPQLAPAAGHLNGGDIDDLQAPPGTEMAGQGGGEIPIHAGRLQHVLSRPQFPEGLPPETPVLAPQNDRHHDFPVEKPDVARIQIGPVVGIHEVVRDRRGQGRGRR